MKAVVALALFGFIAIVSARPHYDGYKGDYYNGGYHGHYGPGLKRTYNGVEARYNNADRQEAVNKKAEYVGASSGTSRYYGVPGGYSHYDGPYHGYGNKGHRDNYYYNDAYYY